MPITQHSFMMENGIANAHKLNEDIPKYSFKPLASLDNYSFVIIVTRNKGGEYLLSKKRGYNTWEFQGGHIEKGESPYSAAKRELREEAGVTGTVLMPIMDYYTYEKDTHKECAKGKRCGMIFYTIIENGSVLSKDSEMEEVAFFSELPSNLTYYDMVENLKRMIDIELY